MNKIFAEHEKHTEFYGSPAWKNIREAYKRKVGGLCELCLLEGRIRAAEIIHHKIPLDDKTVHDPEIALNEDNLLAVCREHHAQIHKDLYGRERKRRYKIDADGRVIINEGN